MMPIKISKPATYTQNDTVFEAALALSHSIPDQLLAHLKTAQTHLQGDHMKRRAGIGNMFWQYRPYAADMDARHIDWRQSAKSDRVYVREQEQETAHHYMFWSANTQNMQFQSKYANVSKQNYAQTLTLALAHIMTRRHDTVSSINAEVKGHTKQTVHALYRHMNTVNTDETSLPQVQKSLPRNHTAVLAGDFLLSEDNITQALSPFFSKLKMVS